MVGLQAAFSLSNKTQEKEDLKAKVTLALFEELKEGNSPYAARNEMTTLINHSGEDDDVQDFLLSIVDEMTKKIGYEAGRLTAGYIADTAQMFVNMRDQPFRPGLIPLSQKGADRWFKALNDESEQTDLSNEDLAKIVIATLNSAESVYLKNIAANVLMQCVVPREGKAAQLSPVKQVFFSRPSCKQG